ncbi:MAG: 6-phosphogluconolactonase, partial [Planctomycetota bacterium]
MASSKPWWNKGFSLIPCPSVADFDTLMGHEIAMEIRKAREARRELALILPVGPMGMYRWTVYFLKEWDVPCDHVHGFNMDEWSDREGRTLPGNHPGAFQNAMQTAFYGPLAQLTVPLSQRHFATTEKLPTYPERIGEIKAKGGRLVTVFGIGRVCHIAFWEPQFAGEYSNEKDWKAATHRLGAKLHPL